MTQAKQKKKKKKNLNKDSIGNLWNKIKCSKTYILWLSEKKMKRESIIEFIWIKDN